MFPEVEDGPSDPRKFRRTLLPLEIEDAEEPPTIGRRFVNLFRKKERGSDRIEEESPEAGPKPPAGPPEPRRIPGIDDSGEDDPFV